MTTHEIIELKGKEFLLNGYRVIVVDAPVAATHSNVIMTDAPVKNQIGKIFIDGATYALYKKSKMIGVYCFDALKSAEQYMSNITVVGSLKTSSEGVVGNLFNPVKRGNFYDYEHNGVFYPNAIGALKDVISQEVNFENPFVLLVKPF